MSTPRFFTPVSDKRAFITGEDAEHAARVLRLRAGDHVTICDGQETEYDGVIVSQSPREVEVQVSQGRKSRGETDLKTYLYVAVPKGDKFESVIQKAVELGVTGIIPFSSKRCVPKWDHTGDSRLARWNRLALEAAKQCGRGIVPVVEDVIPFGDVLKRAIHTDMPLFCFEEANMPIKEALSSRLYGSCAVVTGPEGGFETDEVFLAQAFGLHIVSLGPRILRCETAPIVALTCLMYHAGKL